MIARLIFVGFGLLGAVAGGYLLWQARRDLDASREQGGPVAFIASSLLRSEGARFLQQACFLGVAVNSLIVNQASRFTGGQLRGVALILVAQTLLTLNSLGWLGARRAFDGRYRATTLDLAERLAAMTAERDVLRARVAWLEGRQP